MQIHFQMQKYNGFDFTPTGDVRPLIYYHHFLREAQKQGFIVILPLEPIQDWSCEIYHLTLPVDGATLIDCTVLSTDVCDIIRKYTNWPGLWEALYAKVSGV
jgi:hypothetical protein